MVISTGIRRAAQVHAFLHLSEGFLAKYLAIGSLVRHGHLIGIDGGKKGDENAC
jgi:hypothetical protein